VGVAVNVTAVPLQMVVPGFAAMDTLTGWLAATDTTVAAESAESHPFFWYLTVYVPELFTTMDCVVAEFDQR
jgi:hypothetical protein